MSEQPPKSPPLPWFAVVDIQAGTVLAVFRWGDHAADWIKARNAKANVVECVEPQVRLLARVPCDACEGKGTVLKTYGEIDV